MACKRNPKLKEAGAPHRVEVRVAQGYSGFSAHRPRWKDAQNQMFWLGHPDNGAEGEFYNGWIDESEGHAYYLFTDERTALHFKLAFG
jgi:hypothetical protein